MPAAKICSAPGCPRTQPCPDHPKVPWQGSNRRAQLPPGWSSRIVPRILARDELCTLALVCNGLSLSREVHHVGSPDDHSDANLAGTCKACHTVATQRQAADARRSP
jgi:5-methylcytosine-specific restriction protein A